MKTTMMFRNIANPRRTTLAHLEDADALQTPEQPEHSVDLPTQTANPAAPSSWKPRSRPPSPSSTHADRRRLTAPGPAAAQGRASRDAGG